MKEELGVQIRRHFSWRRLLMVVGISATVLLPCFWHQRIEAGDLGSHTYNAWLTQLIKAGDASGLYLVSQWNNALVDVAMESLATKIGLPTAERVLVCLSVLIFFWGTFAIIQAATGRSPWFLMPAIAMVAYGWTFQMGFLNYYLSLGLACISLALLWRNGPANWIAGLVLALLSLFAHPIGFLWLAATVAYVKIAGVLRGFARQIMLPAGMLIIIAAHFILSRRYDTYGPVIGHLYKYLGPDQLVLYGHRYMALAIYFILLIVVMTVSVDRIQLREFTLWQRVRTPLELWALVVFGVGMLWEGISVPKYAMGLTYIPERLTTISAVLLLCVLGCLPPRKWHLISLASCAAIFFLWIYQDTAMLNRMEEQVVHLVKAVPQDGRVIATIWGPAGGRIVIEHIVDRACVGRCFSYSNYEPSSLQFRVRVRPGSPVATASASDGLAMREGRYLVREEDLPMWQVYQCDADTFSTLCIRELRSGEVNGRIGYHPK
jgi:hypothetical protein